MNLFPCRQCGDEVREKRTAGGRWRFGCCGTYFYAQTIRAAIGAWRAYWEVERVGEQDAD